MTDCHGMDRPEIIYPGASERTILTGDGQVPLTVSTLRKAPNWYTFR